jgi:hypothetical protein
MKLIKILPLAVLPLISVGVHNFPAQAQSSEWEQAQVGEGYSSASCIPTTSLPSGTDNCGNPLTTTTEPTYPTTTEPTSNGSCIDQLRGCLDQRDAENNASGAGQWERSAEAAGCVADFLTDCVTPQLGQAINDVVVPLAPLLTK